VSHDDVLFGYRLRLFTLAEEIGASSLSADGRAPLDLLPLEGLRIQLSSDGAGLFDQ
jgi:hypothetical protein